MFTLTKFLHTSQPKMSDTAKILQKLKRAGHYGQTNIELSTVCLSWHRRVGDLRKEGHNIQSVRITRSGWKYYLNEETQ